MNNKIRDSIIVLSIIANIILFVLFFSEKKETTTNTTHSHHNSTTHTSAITSASSLPETKIAYINIDTLNEKYLYISDYVKVMKKRKETLEAQLQSMMATFQQDYENFQQSAQAGIAPQAELEKQKRKLEQQQKEIQNKQLQMDNLALEL
ncbi:MAG: OmpH family outer membrane protein, partial [Bacteroidia bacterium]|nr:OmpH family outer membrane protein [Bacteroidia bacterium]